VAMHFLFPELGFHSHTFLQHVMMAAAVVAAFSGAQCRCTLIRESSACWSCGANVVRTTNDGSASMVAAFRNGGRDWLQVRAAAVGESFTVQALPLMNVEVAPLLVQ